MWSPGSDLQASAGQAAADQVEPAPGDPAPAEKALTFTREGLGGGAGLAVDPWLPLRLEAELRLAQDREQVRHRYGLTARELEVLRLAQRRCRQLESTCLLGKFVILSS